MKKVLIFLSVFVLITLCGCKREENVIKDLTNKVNKSSAYHMTGTLKIYRNEEIYTYKVDSSYKKGDNFKVSLINKNNDHEQIILKNKEGVYVLTPSLNKSFKFQSDWPYNNSQIYLLQPVIDDINSDKNSSQKKTKSGYVITSKVEYTTEKDFKNQKVYLNSKGAITKIEVVDDNNNVKMSLKINNIDFNAKFDKNYFDSKAYEKAQNNDNSSKKSTENNTAQENNTEDKSKNNASENKKENTTDNNETKNNTVAKIEEIIYPMYVPADTHLSGQNVVNTDNGERAILTFAGESSFTIVQETVKDSTSLDYVYGDPYIIMDTVGALSSDSVSWISNGIEYSVMSDSMDLDEILTVAQSISVGALSK